MKINELKETSVVFWCGEIFKEEEEKKKGKKSLKKEEKKIVAEIREKSEKIFSFF